jgi:hypothetical protein
MEFYDITEEAKVYPGEYLLYKPRMEIVLCGAYIPTRNKIKALARGSMIEDSIQNFQKIKLNKKENQQRKSTRCKGCGSR